MVSAGEALGERSNLEATYLAAIEPEVSHFIRRVHEQASSDSSVFTIALVLSLWAEASEAAALRLGSPVVAQLMGESELPSRAFAAAVASIVESETLALTAKAAAAALRAALGLVGDTLGAITGPGDTTFSWAKASDGYARTAATAAFGDEMLNLLRSEGYTHKRWITRYDSRVRDTHAAADRQTIPLEQDFTVGGVLLRYPGDPLSSAISEVINCRCVLVGVNFGSKYPEPGPENFR